MDIVMTQGAVRASKVAEQKQTDTNQSDDKAAEPGNPLVGNNDNNNVKVTGPKLQADRERHMIQKELDDVMEINRLLKKQLESRDVIIKKQISEIHRLQGENKALCEEKHEMKKANENLRKEYEAEQWLGERLKNDVKDLQIQLDFQDCYLQEQSHQGSLIGKLLNELQNKNDAQEKEIIQLRQQLQTGKEIVDKQIVDLQKMLGIQSQIIN